MSEEMRKKVQTLKELIFEKKPKLVFYLCHVNADPDAFAAAYVLGHALVRLAHNEHTFFILADGYKQVTTQIVNFLGVSYVVESTPEIPDLLIIVDTNNYEQLGKLKSQIKNNIPIVLIDHHHPSIIKLNPPPTIEILDTESTSASELVFQIISELGYEMSSKEATILLTGILYDTSRFIHTNQRVFGVVQKLINKGANYALALELLRKKKELSERIALIKAAQRSEMSRINDWIILVSNVSSYEAAASNMLLSLGADVSIVVAQKKDEFRISIRSTRTFYEETQINLVSGVLDPLLKMFSQINGGGHTTAVGINGVGDGYSVVTQLLKLLKSLLMEKAEKTKHS